MDKIFDRYKGGNAQNEDPRDITSSLRTFP